MLLQNILKNIIKRRPNKMIKIKTTDCEYLVNNNRLTICLSKIS